MTKTPTNFLLYTIENQKIKVDVLIENETVWLNQKQIATTGKTADEIIHQRENANY